MKTFNSVASLKANRLKAGERVATAGQVTPNDGLGAVFYVTDAATPSGDDVVALANGTYAVTVIGTTRFNTVPQMWDGAGWISLV